MTSQTLAALLAVQLGEQTTAIVRDNKGHAQLDDDQEYVMRDVPESELSERASMTTFVASDGYRSIRSLTYGEIAEAFIALGFILPENSQEVGE